MIAMLGQWLGFETSPTSGNARHSVASSVNKPTPSSSSSAMASKQPALTITSPSNSSCSTPNSHSSSSPSSKQPLTNTKSDQLLRDFELVKFLCDVDQQLKEHEQLLAPHDLQRLQALHAQASIDQCAVLADIVEHFEEQHDKLRHRLAVSSPNSAANDALRARWMTVF